MRLQLRELAAAFTILINFKYVCGAVLATSRTRNVQIITPVDRAVTQITEIVFGNGPNFSSPAERLERRGEGGSGGNGGNAESGTSGNANGGDTNVNINGSGNQISVTSVGGNGGSTSSGNAEGGAGGNGNGPGVNASPTLPSISSQVISTSSPISAASPDSTQSASTTGVQVISPASGADSNNLFTALHASVFIVFVSACFYWLL